MNSKVISFFFAWWITEVVLVKIFHGEEVPWWMYGIKAAAIAWAVSVIFKW